MVVIHLCVKLSVFAVSMAMAGIKLSRNFVWHGVHIILRLRNFRMAAVATKNVKNLKCSELDET
jgi:hypothetical protein